MMNVFFFILLVLLLLQRVEVHGGLGVQVVHVQEAVALGEVVLAVLTLLDTGLAHRGGDVGHDHGGLVVLQLDVDEVLRLSDTLESIGGLQSGAADGVHQRVQLLVVAPHHLVPVLGVGGEDAQEPRLGGDPVHGLDVALLVHVTVDGAPQLEAGHPVPLGDVGLEDAEADDSGLVVSLGDLVGHGYYLVGNGLERMTAHRVHAVKRGTTYTPVVHMQSPRMSGYQLLSWFRTSSMSLMSQLASAGTVIMYSVPRSTPWTLLMIAMFGLLKCQIRATVMATRARTGRAASMAWKRVFI